MTDRATFDTQGADHQRDVAPDAGKALVAGLCLAAVVLGGVLAAAWLVVR